MKDKELQEAIKYLLDIYCRQYSNDAELGKFIRKNYQIWQDNTKATKKLKS